VVLDDLDIAPDFFEYFLGLHPILKQDPSLFCVSAWNDYSKSSLIDTGAASLVYRTDFFPGLGWILLKTHWMEHAPKWPPSWVQFILTGHIVLLAEFVYGDDKLNLQIKVYF